MVLFFSRFRFVFERCFSLVYSLKEVDFSLSFLFGSDFCIDRLGVFLVFFSRVVGDVVDREVTFVFFV